jgi:hypothetical protein
VPAFAALLASAAEPSLTEHQKIEGVYRIYGGGLGDEVVPTAKDKKVMFALQGSAARQSFRTPTAQRYRFSSQLSKSDS